MNANKERKRKEAEARNTKWASYSYTEQIQMLDDTFGVGKGASKQRAKIAKKMKG